MHKTGMDVGYGPVMTKEFFNVTPLEAVFGLMSGFDRTRPESLPLLEAQGRVLAEDLISDIDIPGFDRSTMDGYAVCAAATFGASEANPAYLTITGSVEMGQMPTTPIVPGEAARIATGGMLPPGADSVVMLEHAAPVDETTLEVYRSVAPGASVIRAGEDVRAGKVILEAGTRIRAQEMGLLAALGRSRINVFRRPVVGIISTGDEIIPVDSIPGPAQVRDVNSYTLHGSCRAAGAEPELYGLIKDDRAALIKTCRAALAHSDMVLVSGGSSVGKRDLTIEAIMAQNNAEILVHGIPMSPGKPTILARVGKKPFWGLPGHVTSAMVVFEIVVRPFLLHMAGLDSSKSLTHSVPATLSRNIASVHGRIDFARVRIISSEHGLMAEPIPGKSGLIHTMVQADGLVRIDENTEGLSKGDRVMVIPFTT